MESKNINKGVVMKRFFFVLIGITLCLSSCAYAIRYDGPYEGRVIDAETKQPVEGVVVLGVWYSAQFSPAGATHTYYDARETVTDRSGNFVIPGKGLRILSNLDPINILIFKVGYMYESGPWESLKEGLIYKDTIKWEGKKPIIPLRKLTMEERKKSGTFPPYPHSEIPEEKIKLIMKEIYKERKARGLD